MKDYKDVPLGVRIDASIARFTRKTLYWLSFAILLIAGLANFAMIPLSVFEYGEGLYDISMHEWLFIALIALLLWRYWVYCSKFTVAVSTRITRILLFLGGALALEIVAYMALVILGMGAGLSFDVALMNPEAMHWAEIYSWLGVCLTLYLASPYPSQLSPSQIRENDIPVVHAESSPLTTDSHSKEQL